MPPSHFHKLLKLYPSKYQYTTLPPIKKSLNSIVRRKQLKKISEENQFLFKKLANGKSNYDAEKWAKEDNIRIRTLKNICEFPY